MNLTFSVAFCDPLQPDMIALGEMSSNTIIAYFEKIDWNAYLQKMQQAEQDDIHYSPLLELKNEANGHIISVSAVGEPYQHEFNIFYERPKKVKVFFGLIQQTDQAYMTDITEQNQKSVIDCLNALINNDFEYLDHTIGR